MTGIAIIGAGVLGGAIARVLALAGYPVTLYDPTPGGAASPGSLAWLNASFAADPVYNRLRADSLALWEQLELGATPPPIRFPGAILWDQPHFDLDAILAAQQAVDRPARMLDPAAHLAAEPNVPEPPGRALFCEADGFGLPRQITGWFLDQARRAGARVVDAKVDSLIAEGDRIRGLTADGGRVDADTVILATGTAMNDLLAPLDMSIAMDNQPGLLVTTTPAPPLISAMLVTDGLHGWQGTDGRFLIGADFGGGEDINDPETHAQRLVDRLVRLIPAAAGIGVDGHTIRTRPMPADGRPAIGPLGSSGLYAATTHSGMTLAPVVADCLAAEITGTPDPRLAPYRPDRAALR